MTTKLLHYYPSTISDSSGYGIAAQGDIKILNNIPGIEVDVVRTSLTKSYDIAIVKMNPYDIIKRPDILAHIKSKSKKVYLTFVWETDPVPKVFIKNIIHNSNLDGFLTPSYFCSRLLLAHTGKPVYYFPHLIEIPEVDFTVREQLDTFNVLILGQYTIRKGIIDGLITYCRSIGEYTDTSLIIKYHLLTKENAYTELNNVITQNSHNPTNIYLSDNILTNDEIQSLLINSHCLLFLSRGEGFGLPIAEMMATGGRVIYTDWSASSEVGESKYNSPVEYNLDEAVSMAQFGYNQGSVYAIPLLSSAIKELNNMYDKWKENKIGFCKEGKNNIDIIKSKYTLDPLTKLTEEVIKNICQTI